MAPPTPQNGRKRAENGRKWPKIGENGPKMAKNGRKMAGNGPQNGRKCRKAVWVTHQEYMGRAWDHSSDNIVQSSNLEHYGRWRRLFAPF